MNANAIDRIDEILKGMLEIAEQYWGQGRAGSLYNEYQEKRASSLLQVMLFGSYNAGKSSLINALLGKEVAAVGDIPKTAFSSSYYWEGCCLLDTPGVNAPIEHEAVAQAQIDRAELVLFVIRQGDQDVKDVYDRMFSMLEREKQIFVVFNHELAPEELPAALSRLNEIIANFATSEDIKSKDIGGMPIFPINIRTAIKARSMGSAELAEHSGIAQFENAFLSWLRAFDSEYHYLDRLRKYIHQCVVTPLLSDIGEDIGVGDSNDLKDLQHQRDEIVRQYGILESQLANHVRYEIVRLKPDIAGVLTNSASQLELEGEMLKLADKVVQSTASFLDKRCKDIVAELNASIDIPVDFQSEETGSKLGETIEAAALAGAKSVNKDILKDGLLFLRKMKFPGLKGRWEKTLAKWAGKAAWVVTAAVSVYEIYSASSEQDKENAEKRKQIIDLHQVVEGIARDISSAVLDESRKLVLSAKNKAMIDIEVRINELVEGSNQRALDAENVLRLTNSLDSVQI